MTGYEIRDTKTKGKGLFALRHYDKGHVIFRFEGKFVSFDEAREASPNVSERYLQIGQDLYLDVNKDVSAFTNHSCKPNCYVKIAINNAFLISLHPILPGEELTFDYALTSTETHETFSMPCNCNHYGCRKVISGFSTLPEAQQKSSIELGLTPRYIGVK